MQFCIRESFSNFMMITLDELIVHLRTSLAQRKLPTGMEALKQGLLTATAPSKIIRFGLRFWYLMLNARAVKRRSPIVNLLA